MNDKILNILLNSIDQVLVKYGTQHESEAEFDPSNEVLDEVWKELAKDQEFFWETMANSQSINLLMSYIASNAVGANQKLQEHILAYYRAVALDKAQEYESQLWLAYNDTRLDEYEP